MNNASKLPRERCLGNLRPITNKVSNGPSHTGDCLVTADMCRYLYARSLEGTRGVKVPMVGWSNNKNPKNFKDAFFTTELSDYRFYDYAYARREDEEKNDPVTIDPFSEFYSDNP